LIGAFPEPRPNPDRDGMSAARNSLGAEKRGHSTPFYSSGSFRISNGDRLASNRLKTYYGPRRELQMLQAQWRLRLAKRLSFADMVTSQKLADCREAFLAGIHRANGRFIICANSLILGRSSITLAYYKSSITVPKPAGPKPPPCFRHLFCRCFTGPLFDAG